MSNAKVFIVDSPFKANYKVCFVDYDSQQKNHQIIAGGKLVNSEYQANVKVAIVNSPFQADICITHKNFPK